MKTKIIVLFITTILGVLLGCSKAEDEQNQLNYILIGKGNLYGNGRENISKQNLVISDTNSWNELITKMNSVNHVSDDFTEINVDFSHYNVIACFDEIKGTGGHSIDITRIIENENNIIVYMENLLKGNMATVMTQPYTIVKTEKKPKPIIFEKE